MMTNIYRIALVNVKFSCLSSAQGKLLHFATLPVVSMAKSPAVHIIIWRLSDKVFFSPLFSEQTYYPRKKGYDVKCSAWTNGKIFVGNLTEDSANYVAGYMLKKVKGRDANKVYRDKGLIPPFSLMSRKPGLGQEWCKKNAGWLKERGALLYKQRPTPLPRYFLHQLFSKDELVEAMYRRQCEQFVDPLYSLKTAEYCDADLANERIVQAEKNVLARSPKNRERFNDV